MKRPLIKKEEVEKNYIRLLTDLSEGSKRFYLVQHRPHHLHRNQDGIRVKSIARRRALDGILWP
jgi:hypothetical protein